MTGGSKNIIKFKYVYIAYYITKQNFSQVIFRLRRSDIIAIATVIFKPFGFSDILFTIKLAKRIALVARRISLAKQ